MKIHSICTICVQVICLLTEPAVCFQVAPSWRLNEKSAYRASIFLGKENDEDQRLDPITKASWYAVEVFGKVFASKRQASETQPWTKQPPSSLTDTLQRIQVDNERAYFLSGEVDELIYDPDCMFADPFVSFTGRKRFVENLANLGSFITNYSAKPLRYEVAGYVVDTKFMVKLELNLPWKPVLAWPWGVRCEINPENNLIVLHKESWDIEPWEVSQLS